MTAERETTQVGCSFDVYVLHQDPLTVAMDVGTDANRFSISQDRVECFGIAQATQDGRTGVAIHLDLSLFGMLEFDQTLFIPGPQA